MALIECTECGGQVSDQAEACPKCGNPVFNSLPWYDRLTLSVSGNGPSKPREGIFLRTMNALTTVVLIIIGLFVVLMMLPAGK